LAAVIAVVVDNVDDRTTEGLTNLDGGRRSRQGATDDTTTNHQQECWRCSDIGGGCSNSESRGKGEGVVAVALVAAAVAVAAVTMAMKTTVIAAERARMAAMAAANAMVMAAAMAVAAAISTAAAKAALKGLSSSSEAAVVVRQCRSMVGVAKVSLPWQ
jgi:hypothetical protein